jgi:hypothetical protein
MKSSYLCDMMVAITVEVLSPNRELALIERIGA